MRVIAGKAARTSLQAPKGQTVRPTTDRLKETLFNLLQPYLPTGRVLDLFAGSGGLGIEALSRGCHQAYFIDAYRPAITAIQQNLTKTHLTDQATVVQADYQQALARLADQMFDLVFLDPPYGHLLEVEAIRQLVTKDMLTEQAVIVVESPRNVDFTFLADYDTLKIVKQKSFKNNQYTFIQRKEGAPTRSR